mmetsp:Transcript_69953/g.167045  ORF Transcript_69953/g.167045 Transcript_69953/m.167045 type:complete len:325 (-) Transcript_69953:35-1009(-)
MRHGRHLDLLAVQSQAPCQGRHVLGGVLPQVLLEDLGICQAPPPEALGGEEPRQGLHLRAGKLLLGHLLQRQRPHLRNLPGRRPRELVVYFSPGVAPSLPVRLEDFAVRRHQLWRHADAPAQQRLFILPSSLLDVLGFHDALPLKERELVLLWLHLLRPGGHLVQIGHHLVRTHPLRMFHGVLVQDLHLGKLVDQPQPVVWLLGHRVVEEVQLLQKGEPGEQGQLLVQVPQLVAAGQQHPQELEAPQAGQGHQAVLLQVDLSDPKVALQVLHTGELIPLQPNHLQVPEVLKVLRDRVRPQVGQMDLCAFRGVLPVLLHNALVGI